MGEPFQELKETDELVLISKSKNKPGAPVFREDLPSVLFNKAPRVILGSSWFDKYTNSNKAVICESCHRPLPLERHELYGLYRWGNQYIIKLEGIMKICHDCHQKIHGGFSIRTDLNYGFVRNPVPVSDALNFKKYPWNEAKFILIEGLLYLL